MTLNSVFGTMPRLNRILQTTICASILSVYGCEMGPPSVNGAPGAPPAPNVPWKAPAGAIKPETLITAATALAVPPDLAQRIQQLALADVVDLALRNNPATRASWSQARASADLLGSARGQYYPTVNGAASVSRMQSPATGTRPAGTRTEYGPPLSLNYLLAARGGLAAALGLPANLPFDLAPMPAAIPVGLISVSVDSVINAALSNRPDLAAARAQAAAAAAQVRVAKSAEFPALTLGSNAARTFTSPSTFAGPSYSVTLGLAIPIFNGFSRQYDLAAARAQADAISALADQTRQQVVTQVFVSYYALQTAEQRVATADDLLASAQQSVQVAAGRYREGVGSIIDLLTAQTALASARAQQVQSRWQWYTSLAQLARDTGVLGVRGDTPFTFTPDSLVSPQPSNTIRP